MFQNSQAALRALQKMIGEGYINYLAQYLAEEKQHYVCMSWFVLANYILSLNFEWDKAITTTQFHKIHPINY